MQIEALPVKEAWNNSSPAAQRLMEKAARATGLRRLKTQCRLNHIVEETSGFYDLRIITRNRSRLLGWRLA